MEVLLLLFVIGVIGVILIGSILGLTSSGRITKLEQQNRDLNARLKALEDGQDESVAKAASAIEPVAIAKPQLEPKPAPVPWHEREAQTEPEVRAAANTAPAKTSPEAPSWSPPEPPKPKKPSRSLEEIIGGQWSVWVGGLALLVGAVLLIRFSIEAGFFGPTARIIMAMALGGALLLAGEWLKRADDKILTGRLGEAAKALQGNASVPGLLSAVGIFTLLGASYAAHALYGLIPALAAFAALAIISLGAMALSLRQGPLLAAIGLLASMATPLLIETETPSLLMLVVYLVLIGGAALVLSRRTGWGWLATGTVFGWLGWSLMTYEAATNGQLSLWTAFLALGFIVTVWFAEKEETKKQSADLNSLNLQPGLAVFWGGLAAILVTVVGGVSGDFLAGAERPEFSLGLASVAVLVAASQLFPKQSAHLVTGGTLALVFLIMGETTWQYAMMMILILGVVLLAFRNVERRIHREDLAFRKGWSVFAVILGLTSVIALSVEITQSVGILGAAAFVLKRREDDGAFLNVLNGMIEAAALAGLALFAVFQIRHISNNGAVYADSLGHAELGLQVSIGLCFTLAGLSKRFAGNLVLSKMAELVSYLTLAIFAVGSLIFFSPLFAWDERVTGHLIFNSLTTGLFVPTVLLGLCAVFARARRPEIYVNILGGLALAGVLVWMTAMIRFIYNGEDIRVFHVGFGDLELWTISAVWLGFGIALLALGVWRRERALRIASGLVIILTVLKAFLIDMAGLEGVLRAVSFVVLGLILIVIGRAYQRYWLSDQAK